MKPEILKGKQLGKQINTFKSDILGKHDATALAEMISTGKAQSKELVEAAIKRIERVEPIMNAIVVKSFKTARKHSLKPRPGCFSGVPGIIKDLVYVKGLPTFHGSQGLPNRKARKNDKVVDQIFSTGMINLGKSSTSEFGLLPTVETALHDSTANPWNRDYSTGGSSGGAAALVASGALPFAHAMDGGGSIRIPASCCGLIGLKPSRGRHIDSSTAKLPVDVVTHGIVSRSVRDTANYFAEIEKHYRPKKLPEIGLVKKSSKKRLKIGMFYKNGAGMYSHPETVEAVERAGKICESLGHEVELIENPYGSQVKLDFFMYFSFLSYCIIRFGRFTYDPAFNNSLLEKYTLESATIFAKMKLSAPKAFRRLKAFQTTYESMFEDYDVLLSPVLSHPVPKLGYLGHETDFPSFIDKLNALINFTFIQNVSGGPAISLPISVCKNGLPLGVQFAGAIGTEKTLLELAFELEDARVFNVMQ